jgi:phosphoglucosamine mutase
MTEPRMFGTGGVRARVGIEPMTPRTIMRLAHAAGQLLVERHAGPGERPAVAIGTDTRTSADMFEAALQAGFSAAGVDSLLCGQLPTPAIAYLTRLRALQAGAVVSASHNPHEDNGIKFFASGGAKLTDETELLIESRMAGELACVPSHRLGRARRLPTAARLYVDFCKRSLAAGLDLRGMKIVVDAAHGAGHEVAPQVFRDLGAEVVTVGAAPDGININDRVGATAPQHLAQAVLAHHADAGIALDGDGDRLVMADSDGRIYGGDELLYVLATDGQVQRGWHGGVAGTVMSNLGLELALNRRGLAFGRAAVGDRHVLELLRERGWRLGGENSGHIICLDRHSTGDGIIAALQVLGAMRRSGSELAQLCADLSLHAQCLINVPVPAGVTAELDALMRRCCGGVERQLAGNGRVLLRASGTEPVLRVMVECLDAQRADGLARQLAADVAQALSEPAGRELQPA